MEAPEKIEVTSEVVACDGGSLGHPKVFLNMEGKGHIVCPYCSRDFVLAEGGAQDDGH